MSCIRTVADGYVSVQLIGIGHTMALASHSLELLTSEYSLRHSPEAVFLVDERLQVVESVLHVEILSGPGGVEPLGDLLETEPVGHRHFLFLLQRGKGILLVLN